jgi:hypothetical protein
MNKRIDKLFEQALEEFTAENKYATIIVPDPLKEKFAQLIVLECVGIVRDGYNSKLRFGDVIFNMKTHLGVEE